MKAKELLRKKMKFLRESLDKNIRIKKSEIICSQVISFIQTNKIESVHSYFPIHSEVDTTKIISYCLENKIDMIVPKTLPNRQMKHFLLKSFDELTEGKFGTKYPKNEIEYRKNIELIVVPALAFDKQNYRLGYGGGYYDSFLNANKSSIKIGLAFTENIVESVPKEKHDAQVCFTFQA
jgi:5-formyltetrahydrofolate cyclo-ligase